MDTTRVQGRDAPHDEGARLMQKVTENDVDAFECLYDKCGPILEQRLASYNNVYMSSEDFIQEVFTRLWQQRKNFRGRSRFLTYLLGIAKLTMNEEIRQSHTVTIRDLKEPADIDGGSHNDLSQPEAEFFLKELTAALKEVRARLTVKERQALEVWQAGNVSLREASRMLGCSYEALKSRLKRARKRLREFVNPALISE